uniref:Chitin-binding type-2 domain-containing protein n=1 Tax=Magallana gigas TaxID=29159 RepID=A0A8W8LMY2_MAGGI
MKVFCLLAVVGIACAAPERAKRQLVPSNEHCNFQAPNPCSTSKTNTQVFFPHPNDNTKFIQCNAVGEMYIIQCPHGKLYNKATVSCVSQNYIPGGQGSGQIGGSVSLTSNPCKNSVVTTGNTQFHSHPDPAKFIQCDIAGNAYVLACPSGLVWNEFSTTCVSPFTQAVGAPP